MINKIRKIKNINKMKTEIIKELLDYAIYMDYYFQKEEHKKENYEIYLAYENMKNKVIKRAEKRGFIK